MWPIAAPAPTISPAGHGRVEEPGRAARAARRCCVDPHRRRDRRRAVVAHAQMPQHAGDAALDERDRCPRPTAPRPPVSVVIAGLPRVIAVFDKIHRRCRIGRPLVVDDDAIEAEGERQRAARVGHCRIAGRDPVRVRPQRLVAVAAVQVEHVRRARDDLAREHVARCARTACRPPCRETRDSGSGRRSASSKSSGRGTTACWRRGP